MSQSLRIHGWITDEAFEQHSFLRERGDFVGADFDLFNFQVLLHAQEPLYAWRKEKA